MRLAGKEKKAEKKQMIRLRSEPGGYRRKKKLGEEETRGGGKAEGERAGGACAYPRAWGGVVSGEDEFGQNKGPSWIGRPFGNKVLALFYFPT